jgi:hypothetical protein
MYLSLENYYAHESGVFEKLFGRQLVLYRAAVDSRDYETVNWSNNNCPWQYRYGPEFEKVWASRTSVTAQQSARSDIELHE